MVCSHKRAISKSVSTSNNLPTSREEKSKILLIKSSRYCAESHARLTYFRAVAGKVEDRTMSKVPTTPFSGVRSSWLMVAANSAFKCARRKASSLALRKAISRSSSTAIMLLKACAISAMSCGPFKFARTPASPCSARRMASASCVKGRVIRKANRRVTHKKITEKHKAMAMFNINTVRTAVLKDALDKTTRTYPMV